MGLWAVPSSWRFGLLLAAYGLYLMLGAAAFVGLETGPELDRLDVLRQARRRLLAEHRACLSEERLDGLLERLLDARNYGVSGLGNVSGDEKWGFTSALFFAASVLTTTGYGHTMPLSDWGKVLCIFYAFLGIPMTLVLLACLLQRLVPVLSHRPVQYLHDRWGFPRAHLALGHAIVLGFTTFGVFILLPAICFWALEGRWTFLESVYFCFISLSTIGMGDGVPQGSFRPPLRDLYKISITCYLIVGLLALLVALETAYELEEVRAFIRYFAPAQAPSPEDDDRLDILARDQLALATVSSPSMAPLGNLARDHHSS